MLLVVFFGLLIIGIVCACAYAQDWFAHSLANNIALFFGVINTALASVALLVSICILGANYLTIDGDIEKYNKQYESIVFQVENNFYKQDVTGNATRELVKDVENWNRELASKKINQYNLWIGIFIPDIYDQFEFIELDNYVKVEE